MRVKQRVRSALKAGPLIRAVDRVSLRARPRGGTTAFLIAPPGRGNIGDQALVEAFVEATDAAVVVVVRSVADIDIPPHLSDRMSLLPLPALIYGTAIGHARDARRLSRALRDAGSVSIIGADIMDGAYVLGASVTRAIVAENLAARGWPVRILGFSWNGRPHPVALRALRRAADAGATLLVRDPVSSARARADGLTVTDTADLVFLARSTDDAAARRYAGDARFALVNASGLIGGGDDVEREYRGVIAGLHDRGLDVVLVPHVSRAGADDVPLCAALATGWSDAAHGRSVTLVDRLLPPAQIRGMAAEAGLVVTGRMHLAVMSLMAGTPAVTLATQGKVEGLMTLFEAPYLCVDPGPDLAARVEAALVTASQPGTRAHLSTRAAHVRALAAENVHGLSAEPHPIPPATSATSTSGPPRGAVTRP